MKNTINIGITSGHKAGVATEIIEKVMADKSLTSTYKLTLISIDDDPTGVKALEASVEALKSKTIDAVVTAPISKSEAAAAGFSAIGHTEFFASHFKKEGREPLMVLMSDSLKVALVTKHTAISEVAPLIKKELILSHIRSLARSLTVDFKISSPKIAILALNPHAGENGMLGREEIDEIIPAIEAANIEGIYAFGPFAADGYFGSGAYTKFDATLAMYHDQGLAPFKTLAFDGGVNFTAGLPIVRTSPGHGVGLDIAGKGIASASALRAAIYAAADIVRSRRYYGEISANPLKKHHHEDSNNRRGTQRDVNVDELLAGSEQ